MLTVTHSLLIAARSKKTETTNTSTPSSPEMEDEEEVPQVSLEVLDRESQKEGPEESAEGISGEEEAEDGEQSVPSALVQQLMEMGFSRRSLEQGIKMLGEAPSPETLVTWIIMQEEFCPDDNRMFPSPTSEDEFEDIDASSANNDNHCRYVFTHHGICIFFCTCYFQCGRGVSFSWLLILFFVDDSKSTRSAGISHTKRTGPTRTHCTSRRTLCLACWSAECRSRIHIQVPPTWFLKSSAGSSLFKVASSRSHTNKHYS